MRLLPTLYGKCYDKVLGVTGSELRVLLSTAAGPRLTVAVARQYTKFNVHDRNAALQEDLSAILSSTKRVRKIAPGLEHRLNGNDKPRAANER